MRSETEASGKTDSDEQVRPDSEPEILLTEEGEDVWKTISPDNLLIRTLRTMTLNFSKAVEMEAKETAKTLKTAKKVYYGG
jgi:hypothetical protein